MECIWDDALLQRVSELPPELLQIIEHGSNEQYLYILTRAALDPRHTYILLAHCEPIFAHVCATLRSHASLAHTIATLGRIIPFAPYLMPYLERLLTREKYVIGGSENTEEDLLYALGLFRILSFDCRRMRKWIDPREISVLLRSSSRPIVYLSLRILQLYLSGADKWFQESVKLYLGEDSPDNAIDGRWDDIMIDYRFLTLWEEQRFERTLKLIGEVAKMTKSASSRSAVRRILPASFHESTAQVGAMLFPHDDASSRPHPVDESQLVLTVTLKSNLRIIASALRSLQPLILTGQAGSGKTMLIRHVARCLGRLETMITLHLNEQTDVKSLIGIYTTGETPGSFIWKPGVLTTAVREGRWVLIEDLDRAPKEVVGALLPLVERRELFIASRNETLHASNGFRILATTRSTINTRGEEIRPLAHMLGIRHWRDLSIFMPSTEELREITGRLHPSLSALLPQIFAVYERLQSSIQGNIAGTHIKTVGRRATSPQDLLKWCNRVTTIVKGRSTFSSEDLDSIFLEAVRCFVGSLPSTELRQAIVAAIAEELHIDPQRRDYLLCQRDVRCEVSKTSFDVGRYALARETVKKPGPETTRFSTDPHTSRMLESVAATVSQREPLLLVGETGVGKTTAVQYLANQLGKKLVVVNMSQQSEAGDLLGGFKPVSIRSVIVPLKNEFDELFANSFSATKNQQFLELLRVQMSKSNWRAVCRLWQQALKMVDQYRVERDTRQGNAPAKKRKIETKMTMDLSSWNAFAAKVHEVENRLRGGHEAFAFDFVEGRIVKAVRNGQWVLLDEINLASPDTLESISDLFDQQSPSLLLAETGNVERIEAHADFRIFAAMNPATDVGKKDLPPGIRSRFTELYVEGPDKDIKSLQSIVRSYLRREVAQDQQLPLDVGTIYQKIITFADQNKLVDGSGQRPHFSLRTLTRTLSYAKYIAPTCNLRRALYEGFQMTFLTLLDNESIRLVEPLLEQHLLERRTNIKAELQKPLRQPMDGQLYSRPYPGSKHWIRSGQRRPQEQTYYILTPHIATNLENLVRAVSTRQFAVLIQGPTSSGKTSMIEYLAGRTGHEFVRVNNHEHTDLQEYLGTYISGSDGRLQFREGILVRALREGHWIVLDELNLAPTDVLEALNRLLDDNRELFVPETQEVVRPHENFMLFATQNPAGAYGGRKHLSRAFRNRFLELHFDDIPVEELQEILHRRTQLPESRAKRIVNVYKRLSGLRQESRLFEQKSFATLRDLFRWAQRPNDTIEELAANGYMLLSERVRKPEERQGVKDIIEKELSANGPRVRIDDDALYGSSCPEVVAYDRSIKNKDVVWTKSMRRLYVLVSRAIANDEPVLLVGETGCGKTTVCQMLANALGKVLHTVNAHQNTETGDLVGSQRPLRNRAAIEADLRRHLLSSSLLHGLDTAAAHSTESLLDAYDSAIASLSASEKNSYSMTDSQIQISQARVRHKALFEWVDGSLVQAMKTGSFFLLDEISLAEDSVLERINSVLEPQRSILLAEKGSLDSFVTAHAGFQFFATMNPGGDYGKRELSPALRNRFTEIWVPSLDDVEDVTHIVRTKLKSSCKGLAHAFVKFSQWFKARYDTSSSSSISIRDALAWVDFTNLHGDQGIEAAIVHGAALVYIDTLGANPAGLMSIAGPSLQEERTACLQMLGQLLNIDAMAVYTAPVAVHIDAHQFAAGRFSVPVRPSHSTVASGFAFEPPTTATNTMRILRALQLTKPVMVEGSPGVGKTALITAIAAGVGIPLTRINLSDQTDLIDLFGMDVPTVGEHMGIFAWRDAPFLRAMKKGEWVLLDEMNLASQSVLEGLNACFDHRGEIYVPELGQSFHRHPAFRVFAAQNPHHQGGGRKGLPASFVNRFTVVFADSFRAADLSLICRQGFQHIESDFVERAVSFTDKLAHHTTNRSDFGSDGGPWEFNLRDISRWLTLASTDQGLLSAATHLDFVHLLFAQRFRSAFDRASVSKLFSSCFPDTHLASDLFHDISSKEFQLGIGILSRHPTFAPPYELQPLQHNRQSSHDTQQSLLMCVQLQWPVILCGPSGAGKTALITDLAATVGASCVTISMTAETDALDLIGGYEQYDPHRELQGFADRLHALLCSDCKTQLSQPSFLAAVEAVHILESLMLDRSDISGADLERILQYNESSDVRSILEEVQQASQVADRTTFTWLDGLLVEALQDGKWLILDNANLCSPSVLDRLNSLLEPNGFLLLNEHTHDDGSPRMIRPHPDFRVFLVIDPGNGELSRAMRNRAVELYMPVHPEPRPLKCSRSSPEAAMARFHHFKLAKQLVEQHGCSVRHISQVGVDHTRWDDRPLVPRFMRELAKGLYGPLLAPASGSNTSVQTHHDHERLWESYYTVMAQLQMPADSRSVQTLHPLNNQALARISHQVPSEAFSLAWVHGLVLSFLSLLQTIELIEADSTLTSKLWRLERQRHAKAMRSESNKLSSIVVESLKTMAQIVLRWLPSIALLPWSEVKLFKQEISKLCALCMLFAEAIVTHHVNTPGLSTYLTSLKRFRSARISSMANDFSTSLGRVFTELESISPTSKTGRGHACTVLWNSFKTPTPATQEHLQGSLSFEKVLDRFDGMTFRSGLPIETIVDLRSKMSSTLHLAAHGNHSVVDLSEQLQALMLTSGDAEADSAAPRLPHLQAAFSHLHQRMTRLALAGSVALQPQDMVRLEILAGISTRDSQDSCTSVNQTSAQRLLGTLRSSVATFLDGSGAQNPHEERILGLIQTTQHVSLARMELLRSEIKVLSKTIASQAHLLVSYGLQDLDQSLKLLMREVAESLSTLTNHEPMRELGVYLVSALEDPANSAMVPDTTAAFNRLSLVMDDNLSWLAQSLGYVVNFLCTDHQDEVSPLLATSKAWATFACACLRLYIPTTIFDPAVESLLERDIHRHQHGHLSSSLHAFREFRKLTTGHTESIRATMLQDEIEDLGREPPAVQPYRPELSQLPEIQHQLDGLTGIVEPMFRALTSDATSLPLSQTVMNNILKTRERLRDQYRAYDDFKSPVIGFIDCLIIAQHISLEANKEALQGTNVSPLLSIMPLAGGSTDIFFSDSAFVGVQPTSRAEKEQLTWLELLAFRCRFSQLSYCSIGLQQSTEEMFQQFYARWSTELGKQQTKHAAKSNIYKFRAAENEDEDPTPEELEELFPTEPLWKSQSAASVSVERNELSSALASLHLRIYSSKVSQDLDLPGSLRGWLSIDRRDPWETAGGHSIPGKILLLDKIDAELSGGNSGANYNLYADSNIAEVRKLLNLIKRTEHRFQVLHQRWPEHATPLEVLRACGEVLNIAHSAPLSRFLPSVERLHATVNEWQKIASREFSAAEELEEWTNTIVAWRRLELSSWSGLYEREWQQCRRDAASWWYIAYETIIAASHGVEAVPDQLQVHTLGMTTATADFLAASGLGEYSARLDILRSCSVHLAISAAQQPALVSVHHALTNLIAYYSRFEHLVSDALRTGRDALEKEVKGVIQLAAWKDRNIDVLRQSAQSSHKKLLRLIRKYRKLLAQPVTSIVQGEVPVATSSLPIQYSSPAQPTYPNISEDMRLCNAWDERPRRFANPLSTANLAHGKVAGLTDSVDGPQRLDAWCKELKTAIADLQKSTPSTLTEANKANVTYLKTQKRRLLADVLKGLRHMGLQTSVSKQLLQRQRSTAVVLSQLPSLGNSKMHLADVAEGQFHRFLASVSVVRERSRNSSTDLTAQEVGRCTALLESMLHMCIAEYRSVALGSARLAELRSTVDLFRNFAVSNNPKTSDETAGKNNKQLVRASLLTAMLHACVEVLKAQERLSGNAYSELIQSIQDKGSHLGELLAQGEALPPLPPKVQSGDHVDCYARIHAVAEDIDQLVRDASLSQPSTSPVLAQLSQWTDPRQSEHNVRDVDDVVSLDTDTWVSNLLTACDAVLGSFQLVERDASTSKHIGDSRQWLLQQQSILHAGLASLRMEIVMPKLLALSSSVHRLGLESSVSLSAASKICGAVLPVLEAYEGALRDLTELSCNLLRQTSSTGDILAAVFIQLVERGFCSPSEKSKDDSKDKGDIESGTGLGEGEGADDVSKDVEDDEDLSELAEEQNRQDREGELEDEKDAVDMAAQDMKGEIGDEDAEVEEDGDENEGSEGSQHDADEEIGEVDDLDPSAVDEKKWDDEQGDADQEQKTNSAKGDARQPELTAAEDHNNDQDSDRQGEEPMADSADEAEGAEDVEQLEKEMTDAHANDEENLDLPEDMAVEKPEGIASDDTDMDSLGDEEHDTTVQSPAREENNPIDDSENNDSENSQEIQKSTQAGDAVEEEIEAVKEENSSDTLLQDQQDANVGENEEDVTERAGNVSPNDSKEGQPSQSNRMPEESEDASVTGDVRNEPREDSDGTSGRRKDKASHGQGEDQGDDQRRLPYKQIGDALQQWYDQHKDIQDARSREEMGPNGAQDNDMANVDFEHLPDADVEADTQALGTAATEQSTALDREEALPTNGDTSNDFPMDDPPVEEPAVPEVDKTDDSSRMQPEDKSSQAKQSTSFTNKSDNITEDATMADDVSSSSGSVSDAEDDMHTVNDEVDRQELERISQDEARSLWARHEGNIRSLAFILTEHLRLILQPTQATKMRGDFRTGKRLNIKKIIPYIASSYKRDKIWMRRSVPSKRSYQVILAIDDSKSMTESKSRDLAFETLALVARSMSMLEVGELSVVGFGEQVKIALDFGVPFTTETGPQVFQQFTFAQSKTNVHKLLTESLEMFRAARAKAATSSSTLWQLQLIISDGICEDHPSIRQLVRQAHEERIMIVFIVVDAAAAQQTQAAGGGKQSIFDLQTAEFTKDAGGELQVQMVKYLDTFPFRYYLIVRDVQELPGVLAGALRQWFSEVVDTAN